jgi:ParB family chromosome partitioning protein
MISVGFISTLGRLRDIDRDQVAALAASIKEVGLLNPITVYPREIIRNGQPVEGYGLVAGAHRLEACKSLGWSEVPATVVDLSDDERIIAECDENLCGSKLTPSEQAMFTAKRKEAYLRMHPETAAGVAGAEAKHGRADDKLSFADDQAEKTGVDKRTVQRTAERGEKITTAALAMVKNTELDTGVFLDKLKKVNPDNQVEYVDKALRDARAPKRKPVPPADTPLNDFEAEQKWLADLTRVFNRGSAEWRERAHDHLYPDVPVMDAPQQEPAQ